MFVPWKVIWNLQADCEPFSLDNFPMGQVAYSQKYVLLPLDMLEPTLNAEA